MSNQVKNLVRITDFVIIPRYNLNESISQSDTSLSVEDRSASVTQEVRRNNCIFSVTQNTLQFAAIIVVFAGTFYFLWKKSRPQEIRYEELSAEIADIKKTTLITGTIEPRDEVNIKPQISGIISEIYKEAGDQVKEGEVIAKVKVIPEMGSLSSAQSRLRIAELNLEQAQTNFGREKALYDKQLVSAEEYDQVRQALDQAKEEKEAAEEALEVVRDGVSKRNATASSTLIRSTITGLILDVPVKVGNSVIQSNTFNDGTTIATVADMNDLIFKGNLDETEVGKVDEGTRMRITIGAVQGVEMDAVLEYISPKAVQNNGANQFEIKARVSQLDSVKIRSGYSANAEITLEHADSVLAVPEAAISFEKDSTFVYLAEGDGQYKRQPVTTGLSDGVKIEVKSGLGKDQKVRGNQIFTDKK